LKFLLLNQFYPPDTAATGQLLADVAEHLVSEGHEVHAICSAGLYGGGRHRAEAVAHGVRVHRLCATAFGRGGALGRLSDWGSFYSLAFTRSTRLGRFHACLALTTPPFIAAVGARLKRLWNTRLVLWAMDLWPDIAEAVGALRPHGAAAAALRGMARRIHATADAVISLGPAMTRRLAETGVDPRTIAEIPNWVPAEAVAPSSRDQARRGVLPGLDGRFVLMYSGNMGLAHEFDTLLDAARILSGEDASFVFVGGGKRREEVMRGARARCLSNVRFMDPLPLDRLAELLSSAGAHFVTMQPDVQGLVVPSKIYGILAAGRPAILVGPADNEIAHVLAESRSGFAVPNGRPDQLADVVRRLRDQPGLAQEMGRSARNHYQARLGRDRSVRCIAALLAGPLPRTAP